MSDDAGPPETTVYKEGTAQRSVAARSRQESKPTQSQITIPQSPPTQPTAHSPSLWNKVFGWSLIAVGIVGTLAAISEGFSLHNSRTNSMHGIIYDSLTSLVAIPLGIFISSGRLQSYNKINKMTNQEVTNYYNSAAYMSSEPINYSAFNKPVKPVYLWLKLFTLSVIFATMVGFYMGKHGLWDSDSHQADVVGYIFLAAILSAIVFLCISLYSYNRRHDRRLETFAEDNGWRRSRRDHDSAIPNAFEELFDSVSVGFDIIGPYKRLPMRLSTLWCTPGIFSNVICLKIYIPKTVPFIALLSKADAIDHLVSIFSSKPENVRSLQLEGNFNDSYKLFVREDTESDVLEVLTPDVMQDLLSISKPSSISLGGNELSLFLPSDNFTEEKLIRLFATADVVIKDLINNLPDSQSGVRAVSH